MASLSAVIDRFSAPLFIIPDLKVAAYVSEHLEESTHHLIISFFFTLASLFLYASLSSRLQLVSLRHRILSTASLVHRSISDNGSYRNPGYRFSANRASINHSSPPWNFGRTALHRIFLITHDRLQRFRFLHRCLSVPMPRALSRRQLRHSDSNIILCTCAIRYHGK